ncbi:MAG: glycosyltransferase family 10 [Oscillospiraceae bacterium]|nr:glycosyltransferase family 10 [Oscillospiraceae bacterium]
MKTVKINYAGVADDYNKEQNLIYDLLKINGYDVQIVDDPDYLICDFSGENPYQYCGHPQVRIMYSGENFIPDFNLIDYAICPYPIQFGDRNFQLPACVWPRSHWQELMHKNRAGVTVDFVKNKQYFANFIAGHESEYNIRGDFFKKLCEYKRVESPGSYLNNMPNGEQVNWLNDSKSDFQRKCKFTLCFESTNHYGFVTEKIMDAFYADTIPVYYGSPTVTEIFNKDAFINVADYESFDAAIERIKELDQDDEKYLEMLRQPILVNPDYPRELEDALGKYVCHIFDQPLEQAYRRTRVYRPRDCDEYLARAVDSDSLTMKNLILRILEKMKEKTVGILKRS